MSMRRYVVSFIIEGTHLADDVSLNKSNLEGVLRGTLDEKVASDPCKNRSIDTRVLGLTIEAK